MADRKLKALMFFSFAYGGFLLLLFLAQAYFMLWRHEFLPLDFQRRPGSTPQLPGEPLGFLLSPQNAFYAVSGLAFIINGYMLWTHTTDRTKKAARHEVLNAVLTDEEKLAFEKLRDSDGELTQKELSIKLGFSAVKTHRVVARLQAKGVLETKPFGMTNKVILK